MAKKERKPRIVFVDMPRAMDKKKLGGMYTAIEQIKKGKVKLLQRRGTSSLEINGNFLIEKRLTPEIC